MSVNMRRRVERIERRAVAAGAGSTARVVIYDPASGPSESNAQGARVVILIPDNRRGGTKGGPQ